MVYDDTHIALWERGKGSTNENLSDGSKLTVYFRKPQLREEWHSAEGRHRPILRPGENLPLGTGLRGGVASPGPTGKDRDPQKQGHAVLIEIERAEELDGAPLKLD